MAWDRVSELILSIDNNFLTKNNIVWDEDRDVETLHADYCWTRSQRWLLNYFKQRQRMSITEIADFLRVARKTVYAWDRKENPVQMMGPMMLAAFSKARGKYKDDFVTREPTPERLHVLGIVALTELAKRKWFGDALVLRRHLGDDEKVGIIKLFKFLIIKKMILGRCLGDDGGPQFFRQVREFPISFTLTDVQIADVFEDWLKPFITVYLEASTLFDDRLTLPRIR